MLISNIVDPQIIELSKSMPWFVTTAALCFLIYKTIKWLGVKINDMYDLLFNHKNGKMMQLLEAQVSFVESVKQNNDMIKTNVLTTLEAIKSVEKKLTHISKVGFETMNSEYFNVLFENSPVPIAFIDGNYEFVSANDKCCELLGYSESELLGKSMRDVVAEKDRDTNFTQAEKIKSGEVDSYRLEKTFVRKNGDPIYCIVYAYRIPTEGTFNHYVEVIIPSGEFQLH